MTKAICANRREALTASTLSVMSTPNGNPPDNEPATDQPTQAIPNVAADNHDNTAEINAVDGTAVYGQTPPPPQTPNQQVIPGGVAPQNQLNPDATQVYGATQGSPQGYQGAQGTGLPPNMPVSGYSYRSQTGPMDPVDPYPTKQRSNIAGWIIGGVIMAALVGLGVGVLWAAASGDKTPTPVISSASPTLTSDSPTPEPPTPTQTITVTPTPPTLPPTIPPTIPTTPPPAP